MVAEMPLQRIAVFAGGTGGHVYPALAVATELSSRGYEIQWFGTVRGLEARVVPAAGFALHCLEVSGWRGKGPLSRVRALLSVFYALLQSIRALAVLRPVCALGMGGYVSGPAGLAAWLLRIPLVIHEQNSVAGTTNRLLYRLARVAITAYPEAFGHDGKTRQIGNPVRAELLAYGSRFRDSYDFDGSRPLHLLMVGGSLGALPMNKVVPQAVALAAKTCQLEVRHQTGPRHEELVRDLYRQLGSVAVEVQPYIEDMASAYAWADLVLCRAGALTIAELGVMARPSVLVPLPQAIDNHQWHNAAWLAEQGAARLLPQSEMSAESIADCITGLAASPGQLRAMSRAAASSANLQATSQVADICEEVRRGN